MKKFVFFLSLILLLSLTECSLATEEISPVRYDTSLECFVFNPPQKENFNNTKDYKLYKKISKLYKKGKYEKILELDPDFIPALFALYKKYEETDPNAAIEYLKMIKNPNPYFSEDYISKLLFKQYYRIKDNKTAIEYFNKISDDKSDIYACAADCYLNLNQTNKALKYASLTSKSNNGYYKAQEIKFKILYRKKDFINANKTAKELIRLKPDIADNYIRAALTEKNSSLKLGYFYKARELARNSKYFYFANAQIAKLEQKKLDNYYKKQNKYIDKLNWLQIVSNSPTFGSDEYWIERQDNFFKQCNYCINQYKGEELAKCFRAVKQDQNDLAQQLNFAMQFENKDRYQRKIVRQNDKKIQLMRSMLNEERAQTYNQMEQNYLLHNLNNSVRRY